MIENQNLIKQLLDMIETLLEASEYLYHYTENEQYMEFSAMSDDMYTMLSSIIGIFLPLKKEEDESLTLPSAISIRDSLTGIAFYAQHTPQKALHKIEYELIPLIEEMRMRFYFWNCIWPEPKKRKNYYKNELPFYNRNVYLDRAEKTGKYAYDVSFVVLAYNKLDYTKMCLESLKKFMPENLNYELILVNHGSSDGTKEYFEGIRPDKQLDISVNDGGLEAVSRIQEGKYSIHISNDVVVTPHAIENLLHCMESDDSIAWAVPATSNISNYQTLPFEYNSMEELWRIAEQNNISDSFRWEQRVRLCNPIDIRRNCVFNKFYPFQYLHSKILRAFPDDKVSLILRRNGYKLMLVKDAYCHHFGSITIKDEIKAQGEQQTYLQGRQDFYNAFHVDPWGKGMCYDRLLFEKLPCNKTSPVKILGINCGLGSNSLKIKELLKEKVHNTQCTLCNYTSEAEFLEDLTGISDKAQLFFSWDEFNVCNQEERFDYILVEDGLEQENNYREYIENFEELLNDNGFFILKCREQKCINWIKTHVKTICQVESEDKDSFWFFWKSTKIKPNHTKNEQKQLDS